MHRYLVRARRPALLLSATAFAFAAGFWAHTVTVGGPALNKPIQTATALIDGAQEAWGRTTMYMELSDKHMLEAAAAPEGLALTKHKVFLNRWGGTIKLHAATPLSQLRMTVTNVPKSVCVAYAYGVMKGVRGLKTAIGGDGRFETRSDRAAIETACHSGPRRVTVAFKGAPLPLSALVADEHD